MKDIIILTWSGIPYIPNKGADIMNAPTLIEDKKINGKIFMSIDKSMPGRLPIFD
tara:strand:+ start:38 stop:202 length:165 start_codon:yes stop_codon:yes gene_type:complete